MIRSFNIPEPKKGTLDLIEGIVDVIADADEDVDSVLTALAAVITLQMSYVCPNRRKEIARSLMRSIPV